jgi:hypothetical protein
MRTALFGAALYLGAFAGLCAVVFSELHAYVR